MARSGNRFALKSKPSALDRVGSKARGNGSEGKTTGLLAVVTALLSIWTAYHQVEAEKTRLRLEAEGRKIDNEKQALDALREAHNLYLSDRRLELDHWIASVNERADLRKQDADREVSAKKHEVEAFDTTLRQLKSGDDYRLERSKIYAEQIQNLTNPERARYSVLMLWQLADSPDVGSVSQLVPGKKNARRDDIRRNIVAAALIAGPEARDALVSLGKESQTFVEELQHSPIGSVRAAAKQYLDAGLGFLTSVPSIFGQGTVLEALYDRALSDRMFLEQLRTTRKQRPELTVSLGILLLRLGKDDVFDETLEAIFLPTNVEHASLYFLSDPGLLASKGRYARVFRRVVDAYRASIEAGRTPSPWFNSFLGNELTRENLFELSEVTTPLPKSIVGSRPTAACIPKNELRSALALYCTNFSISADSEVFMTSLAHLDPCLAFMALAKTICKSSLARNEASWLERMEKALDIYRESTRGKQELEEAIGRYQIPAWSDPISKWRTWREHLPFSIEQRVAMVFDEG